VQPYAWSRDLEAVAMVPVLALAYLAVLRVSPTERWRIAGGAAGLALIVVAFVSPLQRLALHYLLTAHLLQNVVLAEWAPALLVYGLPPALARRVRVPMPAALAIWLGTYYAWHAPWIYDQALEHSTTVLHVEHLTYLLAGALFWWPVAHGRESSGAKALYLFAAFVLASPLGLLLALLPRPVYAFYAHAPRRLWGLSRLADQELAGATMASEQAIVLFAFLMVHATRFLRAEAAEGVYAPLLSDSSTSRVSSTPVRQTRSTSSSGRSQ
jgi:cytochrome c oxidase assembly factor CtaG